MNFSKRETLTTKLSLPSFMLFFALFVTLGLQTGANGLSKPSSNNTDCRAWSPSTALQVTVAGSVYFGAECNTVLQDVNITVFCYPNATIHIDQWNMQGGYVAIVGPPDAPWNVSAVSVVVTSTFMRAVGGPAVGVVLGYGWPIASGTLWAATNVTLAGVNSTLLSTSPASASVLGCTLYNPYDATASVDVLLSSVFFSACRCTVAATGSLTSATVGIALALVNQVVVSRSSFAVLRSSVSASSVPLNGMRTASAVGGVSIAQAANVAVDGSLQCVSWSNVSSFGASTSGAGDDSFSAAALGGVAVANAVLTSNNNSTQCVAWSSVNATSSSTAVSNANSFSVAAVGGLAVARSVTVIFFNSTQYVFSSVVDSNSSATSGGANNHGFGGSVIGGVAVGSANIVSLMNCTQSVVLTTGRSRSSSLSGGNSYSSSTIAGVAVSNADTSVTVSDSLQLLSTAHASSDCTALSSSQNSVSNGASTLGGVAVAFSANLVVLNSSTQCTTGSTVSCTANSAQYNSYSASAVGGFVVANANSVAMNQAYQLVISTVGSSYAGTTTPGDGNSFLVTASAVGAASLTNVNVAVQIGDSLQFLTRSNISSSAASMSGYTSLSSTGSGGLSIANAKTVSIANTPQFVSWSNVSSSALASSAYNGFGSSANGAIAVAYAKSVWILNSSQYLSLTNMSGDTSSSYHNTYGASAVGGVAVADVDTVSFTNNTQYVVRCNLTSRTTCSATGGNSYTVSSSGGVAVATTTDAALGPVISASAVQACAYGTTRAAACGAVTTSGCCSNSSTPDLSMTLLVLLDPAVPCPPALPTFDDCAVDVTLVKRHKTLTHTGARRVTCTLTRLHNTGNSRSVHPHGKHHTRTASNFAPRHGTSITVAGPRHRGHRTKTRSRSRRLFIHQHVTATVGVGSTTGPSQPSTAGHPTTFVGVDGTATRAIVIIGYGSAVVAATLSPTSGNKPSMVSRMTDITTCPVMNSNSGTFPSPNAWSLLPSVSAPTPGATGSAAGMLLTTASLLLLVLAGNVAWTLIR